MDLAGRRKAHHQHRRPKSLAFLVGVFVHVRPPRVHPPPLPPTPPQTHHLTTHHLTMIDWLTRLFPRRPPATKSLAGPCFAFDRLTSPAWAPRDYAAFAREGFMGNAIVYRCVRMIAETAASVPLLLYRGEEEIEAHALSELIERPNQAQVGPEFLESLIGHLLVAGNSYIEAVAIGDEIRELHVLRPDRMKVVPGAEGWPEAYEYTCAGRTIRFEDEPVAGVRAILHLRLFHPVNNHYGMSPVEAAAQIFS